MMRNLRRYPLSLVLSFLLLAAANAAPQDVKPDAQKPKLVLLVVVDQFRYDYLLRFRDDYHGGIARLLNNGAVFADARYPQFPTVTAVGHSTIIERRHAFRERHYQQRVV